MDEKYCFKGSQETGNGRINLNGYFQMLPEKREFEVPIKGELYISKKEHRLNGSINNLLMDRNPTLDFFAENDLERFMYKLNPLNFKNGRIYYGGLYFPAEEIALMGLEIFMFGGRTPESREVSLELDVGENLVKEFLFS